MANKLFPFWQELRKLLIDRNDGTFAERVEAYPPKVLMTDGDGTNARLRVDVARVVTSSATSQQVTVGGQQSDERGLPAGSYYIRLANMSNGTSTGVYSLFWEERP